MTTPAKCSSCKAPIRWAETRATGTPIPLDLEPDDDGNVVLEEDLLGDLRAVTLGPGAAREARARGETLYMPHHATCPDGPSWRNR